MTLSVEGAFLKWSTVNTEVASRACAAFIPEGNGGRVPFSYENAYQLANAGIEVITPMALEYDYPIKAGNKPYIHQMQGADFLAANRRAYLFMGAGTGKTLTAAWAMDYLLRKGVIQKVLVITTLSTIFSAWASDLAENLPHLNYKVLVAGTAKTRRKYYKSRAPVHVINHDGAANDWKFLAQNDYDLIVIDESTVVKNISTNRFRGMQALKQSCHDPRLWLMTATPCAQSPEDAYGQIVMVSNVDSQGNRCPPSQIIGSSFMSQTAWRDLTTNPAGGEGWEARRTPKDDANDIIFRYMRPVFSKRTRDCVDLPPEIRLPIPDCAPTPEMKRAWDDLRKKQKVEMEDKTATAESAPAVLAKALQVACGFVYADSEGGDDWLTEDTSSRGQRPVIQLGNPEKNRQLIEYIEGAEGKAVVYVPFTAGVDMVDEFLRSKGYRTVKIYGTISPREVQKRINVEFQSEAPGSPQVLVAQPEKISHGITATAANIIIWYGPITKGEAYQQANMRLARIGQKRVQYIAHLSSSEIEKRRYDQLKKNHNRQQDFMALYEDFHRGVI